MDYKKRKATEHISTSQVFFQEFGTSKYLALIHADWTRDLNNLQLSAKGELVPNLVNWVSCYNGEELKNSELFRALEETDFGRVQDL